MNPRPVIDTPSRLAVATAAATWVGVVGFDVPAVFAFGLGTIGAVAFRSRQFALVLAAFCLLGLVSGAVEARRTPRDLDLESGRYRVGLRIAEDESAASFGLAVGEVTSLEGIQWNGPRVGVRRLPEGITVGAHVVADGKFSPGTRRVRDEVVSGVVDIAAVVASTPSANPVVTTGNAVRRAVDVRYDGTHAGDGLLAGFLTGNTDGMTATDTEALRLAGLSHFVAVSGSNVALFLGVWWLVTAPLSIHRRLRLAIGVIGLLLFAVITRWEPSVVRACAMASVVVGTAALGIPVTPWVALGGAVTGLLLASGGLAWSVGFQLSVLATAGVLVGLGLAHGRKPRWLVVPLLSTIGAQAAVAPLLLLTFGTVPLLAPITNLIAAPIVAGSTIVAAVGVLVPPAAFLARLGAAAVQLIADHAASWPQLGPLAFAAAASAAGAWVVPVLRPTIVAATIVGVLVFAPWNTPWPNVATVTVLDVGQGDAILLQTPDRRTLLVDGGSDPRVLDRSLRRHGVRTVDTVVVTHADDDHAGGLVELVADGRVGRLVVSAFGGPPPLTEIAEQASVSVVTVRAGDRLSVGGVRIDIVAPHRRFRSDNDGSVVLLIAGARTVLLPGDIESVAQRELPKIVADVLIVPHHGSATSDRRWLSRTVGEVAVLSYGINRYGHPHPDIVAALEGLGVDVFLTPEGDISIPLVRTAHVTQGG